jgi:hypothetical protein
VFVGHLALGFAAKRWTPKVGLAWLVAAVVFVDLLWPIFLLAGVERIRIAEGATAFNRFLFFESYPWSHSLLMGLVWGVALGAVARWRGIAASSAVVIGALVVSHWILDFATHAPDMPLWPGPSPRFGLGLWNSVAGTFLIEGALWAVGIAIYLRTHPLLGFGSHLAFWSFVLVCTVMWAGGPWGPMPPSPEAVGWFGLIGWLTIPWAMAADRRPVVNES